MAINTVNSSGINSTNSILALEEKSRDTPMNGRFRKAHDSGEREDEHGGFRSVAKSCRKALAGCCYQQLGHTSRVGEDRGGERSKQKAPTKILTIAALPSL